MNLSLWGLLNGIARDARTAQDMNTMSLIESVAQRLEQGLGTTYDASTSYTTNWYITGPGNPGYPAGSIAPSWDAQSNLGLANPKSVGG